MVAKNAFFFLCNCSFKSLQVISSSYWRHLKKIMMYPKFTLIVLTFKTKVQEGTIWTMTWIQKKNLRRKVNSTRSSNASTEGMQDFPVIAKGKKLLPVCLKEFYFHCSRFQKTSFFICFRLWSTGCKLDRCYGFIYIDFSTSFSIWNPIKNAFQNTDSLSKALSKFCKLLQQYLLATQNWDLLSRIV